MKNLTAREFHKELENSGTTIKDLLLDNLDYVECELDEGGSYLGYSVFIVCELCDKVEGAEGGNEVSHHVLEGGLADVSAARLSSRSFSGLLEFYLKGGFCERAVVEVCLMVGESKREFKFLLDCPLTIELDNCVIDYLGYGGLEYGF